MSQKEERRNVTFRRIGGRIVPIAIGTGGAALAADAARTKRIYSKAGVTVDRKKFTLQPFVYDRLGTKLVAKVDGKKAGTASFFRGADADFGPDMFKSKTFGFSWLGVKGKFRGQGISKLLSKEAAKEIKGQGGNKLWNQVVHPGSLATNYSSKRDKLFKITETAEKKVGLKAALGNIKYWRNKKGVLTSDIFRETSLKGIHRSRIKPFRTMKNKVTMGLGLLAVVGGFGYAAKENK